MEVIVIHRNISNKKKKKKKQLKNGEGYYMPKYNILSVK